MGQASRGSEKSRIEDRSSKNLKKTSHHHCRRSHDHNHRRRCRRRRQCGGLRVVSLREANSIGLSPVIWGPSPITKGR